MKDGPRAGVLAALGSSGALAAMLFASRLPPGPEFILPRRGGYFLYRAGWAMASSAAGRTLFSLAMAAVLVACVVAAVGRLRRGLGRRPRGARAWVGTLIGPVFAAFLCWRLLGRSLDLIQSVWFPYGGMDAREPLVAFVLFGAVLTSAVLAAGAWVSGRRARGTVLLGFLIAADVAAGIAAGMAGVGRAPDVPEASGRTLYVVLTEGEHGPAPETYRLSPDVFSSQDRRPALRASAERPRDARALPALRALYEEETKRWDLQGLRDSLLLGASRRDPLAVSVLLTHLRSAVPSPSASAVLGALSDESVWRVGPLGAAALARAYARLGDLEGARLWAARAGGSSGIPTGLLDVSGGGALRPGRLRGRVLAPRPFRVALYAKPDPGAPYLLDAGAFVASAEPDTRGGFEFTGLPAGRYYLALAFPEDRRGEVSVNGSRGDLVLDARRPSLDLPPLSITFRPR